MRDVVINSHCDCKRSADNMIPEGVEIRDFNNKNVTETEAKAKMEQLRNLVQDNAKLQGLRKDDIYLLRFLHSCKFNVENAYAKMDAFYELLVEFPEWFHKTSPVERRDLLERHMSIGLAERDRCGRSIYLCKIGNVNPSQVTIKEVLSIDDMWLEFMMDDPMTQCKGISVLIDVSGMSMKLVQWLSPGNIRFGLKKLQTLPVTEMIFHVVNTSFILETCLKIVWPFMNQSLKDSIKFHYKNWDSLHEYISPEVLPEEYGGTATISFEKLNERLLETNNEFVEKTKYINFIVTGK